MSLSITTVYSSKSYNLAEGPIWSRSHGEYYWVDINSGTLWRSNFVDCTNSLQPTEIYRSNGTLSAVFETRMGSLVVARKNDLIEITADGTVLSDPIPVARPGGTSRLNDGAVDSSGNVWVGGTSDEETSDQYLYRVGPGLSSTKKIGRVAISNGVAWSPDGSTMYFVDSAHREIRQYDYQSSGEISNPSVFYDTSAHAGVPDGLAVDIAGTVWVAMWGGGCLLKIADNDATVVDLPVQQPTSICFGGHSMHDLLITSALQGLKQPNEFDGKLLLATNLPNSGVILPYAKSYHSFQYG